MRNFFSNFGWLICLVLTAMLSATILSLFFNAMVVFVCMIVLVMVIGLGIVLWKFRRYFVNLILICILLVSLTTLGYMTGALNGYIGIVFKGVDVKEDVNIKGDLAVDGDVNLNKDLNVKNDVKVDGSVKVAKDVEVNGDVKVDGTVKVAKDVEVQGDVVVDGSVYVKEDVTIDGDVNTKGDINVNGDINVKGDVNVDGKVNTNDPTPIPVPTKKPTPVPTKEPTQVPTQEPIQEPTKEPTPVPTKEPTPVPTQEPIPIPEPVKVTSKITWGDHIDGATEIFASVVLSGTANPTIESNLSYSIVKVSDTVYHVKITISEGSHGVAAISVTGNGITGNESTKNY